MKTVSDWLYHKVFCKQAANHKRGSIRRKSDRPYGQFDRLVALHCNFGNLRQIPFPPGVVVGGGGCHKADFRRFLVLFPLKAFGSRQESALLGRQVFSPFRRASSEV